MKTRTSPVHADRITALLAALRDLPIAIEHARWERQDVSLPSYPDGPRPSSSVHLEGGGRIASGEHVGWTGKAHDRFGGRVTGTLLRGSWALGRLSERLHDALPEPYDRAAVEAAALALALAQNGTGLDDLLGVAAAPLRYVVSFDAASDPAPRMRDERRSCATCEFKLDVDPAWKDEQLDRIADAGRVAVLDFKGFGSERDHERFAQRFPEALLEDPFAPATIASVALWTRSSVDAPIASAQDVRLIEPKPAAVNVKAARIGGVLEAIEAIAIARERGMDVYLGGMFEVGVGRRQSQSLAALLCPDGPNDVAPLHPPERPPRVVAAGGGFLR
jgi:L-alanine-DL-glutamate epimerase-like enolase superfamily enzyme